MTAELLIQATFRNGKTILKNSFHSPPFKLADITEDKNDSSLRLMMMTSSPGILDNDDHRITIELEEGCSAELQTQSYQRLFQMKKGASQQIEVKMAKGSSLVFLPHPCVPHKSSVFFSSNKIYLSEGCFLAWGELITCGRKMNGEVFRFSKYHSLTEIYLDGKLIMKENLQIVPGVVDVHAMGQLEGYTHQASLTCISSKSSQEVAVEKINDQLLKENDICFGVSAFSPVGLIVRILGYKAEHLYNILRKVTDEIYRMQETGKNSSICKMSYKY